MLNGKNTLQTQAFNWQYLEKAALLEWADRSAAIPPQSTEMPLAVAVAVSTPSTKNPNFVETGKEMLFLHTSASAKNTLMDWSITGNPSS